MPEPVNSSSAGSVDELQIYRTFRNKLIADRTRPTYHLVCPEGKASPADPNGAIYWKGRYHLHFIFPGGYAHVSSVDMVHWRWHPMTRLGSGRMNSGGCFLNRLLVAAVRRRLVAAGLQVLEARQVPPNDGGLSLGQAWIALQTEN